MTENPTWRPAVTQSGTVRELCKRGLHDLTTPENFYIIPSRGTGTCLPCSRMTRRWRTIISRCSDPSDPDYKYYGARGITIAPEWAADFEVFYAYVGDPPEPGLTLDRINNDGNYEPGNVRWATLSVQNSNRREMRGGYCRRGHDLNDPQHATFKGGHRRCHTCQLARGRERHARARARRITENEAAS